MTYVKMMQTRKICEDGFIVKQLTACSVYDLRESTARDCFRQDWAVKPNEEEIADYERKKLEVANAISSFGNSYTAMFSAAEMASLNNIKNIEFYRDEI